MSDGKGTVAITLKKSDSLVLFDSAGNEIAAIFTNDRQLGKTMLVVVADRSIKIGRQKREPTEGTL